MFSVCHILYSGVFCIAIASLSHRFALYALLYDRIVARKDQLILFIIA